MASLGGLLQLSGGCNSSIRLASDNSFIRVTCPNRESARLDNGGKWRWLSHSTYCVIPDDWAATRKTFIHSDRLCGYYTTSLINFLRFLWSIHSIFHAYLSGLTIFFYNLTSRFLWPACENLQLFQNVLVWQSVPICRNSFMLTLNWLRGVHLQMVKIHAFSPNMVATNTESASAAIMPATVLLPF